MPWPFRRRRPGPPSRSALSGAPAAPVTLDDLGGSRRLTARPGSWQTLGPLRPAATGAAAPIVSSSASFIGHLAGTRSLVSDTSLREVSSEGPRGISYGLAQPLPGEPATTSSPVDAETEVPVSAEQYVVQEATRRPVVASGPPPHGDLTSYLGDLQPAEREPDVFSPSYVEPSGADPDIPEELPPPIFTSMLAERTGRDLSELRPDLADADHASALWPDEGDGSTSTADSEPSSARRHTLAESRRLGLGAPLPSRPVDLPSHERLEPPVEPEPIVFEPPELETPPVAMEPPPPEPQRRVVAHYRRAEVPPEVRSGVTRALGHDPGSVSIRRDEEASSVAARIGARAFTRAGEVFLPMEAGPLDAPETRAVLAHELTHAVQHRVYGGNLPRTSSEEGRRLEAEAHAVERYVRGDDPAPRIAPLRTLRATTGEPPIDSGGFVRSVTEELVARGAAKWDDEGSLVFRPPHGADEEWRAPTAQNSGLQIAMGDDQRATTTYGSTRGGSTTPDDDRRENDRHLRFVHQWRLALQAEGGAIADDAEASLAYESRRGASPDAQTEREEFERHLQFVNDQGGGESEPEINIVSGGLGTALSLGTGLFDEYDEVAEERATRHALPGRTPVFVWDKQSSAPSAGNQPTSSPSTKGESKAGGSSTASTPDSSRAAGSSAPAVSQFGSSEGHWENDAEKPVISGGFGVAIAEMGTGLFDAYDEDLSGDSHWGQHWVPPSAPSTGAHGDAAGARVGDHGTHREMEAAGSHGRERSISGTDPTDVVAHLDDQDLEDLATMLYARLQTRLRRDLIVDRERSGFLTDFR